MAEEALLAELRALCRLHESDATYSATRERFCAINIALNRRGTIAPRFRPNRRARAARGLSAAQADRTNDLQVVDLHWLFARGFTTSNPVWEGMFRGGDLDWEAASRFVETVGKGEQKCLALGILEIDQLALAVIQTERVRHRWQGLKQNWQETELRVGDALMRARKVRREAIADRVTCFRALKFSDWTPSLAARIYQLMTGKSVTQQAMSNRLAMFRRLGLATPAKRATSP